MKLVINNKEIQLNDKHASTPLLWVLRDQIGLTGVKYSCGIGICGTCTVLVDGDPVPSCSTRAGNVVGKEITTIEGLSNDNSHPLQQAWEEIQVPQCGYCQSGQILTALALLNKNPDPEKDEIKRAMSRVNCRCGTYPRIIEAVQVAARKTQK